MMVIALRLMYYMTNMNKEEKEKLVISLRQQGMTYAQIAKEAHVSPRDIGPILNMAGVQETLSNSSRAYKLFAEGKSPIEVAVLLNLREKEVTEFYTEFWRLCHLRDLYQIYEEVKADMSFLIELYRSMTYEGMNIEHVVKLLKLANNGLPSIEARYRELEKAEPLLHSRIQETTAALQRLNDRKSNEEKILKQNRSESNQLKEEIKNLKIEKMKIENAISSFKNNNEISIRIRKIVKQEIENLQSNPRRLIRCALASIFQSETNRPGRLMTLYYNNPPTLSVERILSVSQKERSPNQASSDEYRPENLLLDEAEQFLNRIEESLANKSLDEITNDTSEMFPVPNVLPGSSVNEDCATAINVFTNDAELPYLQSSVPKIQTIPSLHEDHHTSHHPSADKISFGKIFSNWANEYVKNLRFTNKQNIGTVTTPREEESEI